MASIFCITGFPLCLAGHLRRITDHLWEWWFPPVDHRDQSLLMFTYTCSCNALKSLMIYWCVWEEVTIHLVHSQRSVGTFEKFLIGWLLETCLVSHDNEVFSQSTGCDSWRWREIKWMTAMSWNDLTFISIFQAEILLGSVYVLSPLVTCCPNRPYWKPLERVKTSGVWRISKSNYPEVSMDFRVAQLGILWIAFLHVLKFCLCDSSCGHFFFFLSWG